MKLGIIGAGSIVPHHIAAAIEVGFIPTLICGRQGSPNAKRLASKVKGLEFAGSTSDLLEADLDAILIATPASNTLEILLEALDKNVPILVEKPVTTVVADFQAVPIAAHNRIIVGYNRRHYSSVQKFRALSQSEGPGLIQISIPELATTPQADNRKRNTALLENSIHILDLANFLFDSIVITDKRYLNDEFGHKFILANFTSNNTSYGTITIAYGIPENSKISLWSGNKSIDLSPIEKIQITTGMTRLEPTPTEPIARYVKQYSNWVLGDPDITFKPGFIRQYLEFYSLSKGERIGYDSATIMDAQKAVALAHSLIN